MSEYKFKNLNEIATVAEPAEGTTMMGFENGVPIQMPMSAVKGSGGVFLIDLDDPDYSETDTAYGDKIKEALLSGKNVLVYNTLPASTTTNDFPYGFQTYDQVFAFAIGEDTEGHIIKLDVGPGPGLTFHITVD